MTDSSSAKSHAPSRSPLTSAEFDRVAALLDLSPQQAGIVELLLEGMKNKQIAAAMGVKMSTIRTYLSRIFADLGVADRVELVLRVWAAALRNRR